MDAIEQVNIFINHFCHFHILDDDHKDIVINKILKKEYKELYDDLEQLFSDDNNFKDLKFYQFKLAKCERLIFTFHQNILDEKIWFIPLIFDLNHLIYKSKDKSFDNNFKQKKYEWDLKNKQGEIIDFIKKQLS